MPLYKIFRSFAGFYNTLGSTIKFTFVFSRKLLSVVMVERCEVEGFSQTINGIAVGIVTS